MSGWKNQGVPMNLHIFHGKFLFLTILILLSGCGLETAVRPEKINPINIEISGCLVPFATNYRIDATVEDGSCQFTKCFDSTQDNFNDSNRNFIEEYAIRYEKDLSSILLSNCNGRSGCTNSLASNRDLSATKENGSCLFSKCFDATQDNFNDSDRAIIENYAATHKKNMDSLVQSTCNGRSGCTHLLADNRDLAATKENGTCKFSRCFDSTQDNFNDSDRAKILEYAKSQNLAPDSIIASICNGRSGCTHTMAKNKDPIATKENGTCQFEVCIDENFEEYLEFDAQVAKNYLQKFPSGSIKSTCSKKKIYCENPEATNFTQGSTKGDQYCIFKACTQYRFEGFKKYISYLEYLKSHKGEIIEDNSSNSCGMKLIDEFTRETDIKKDNVKTPVRVSFLIDDSGSMGDEVDRVRDALINLSELFITFNTNLILELHQLDDVNKYTKIEKITNNLGQKIERTTYLKPTPVKELKITGQTNLNNLKKDISEAVDTIMAITGSGNEMGLCYLERVIRDFRLQDQENNLITVLITDEDDNYRGSSKNCNVFSDNLVGSWTHTQFTDSNGKDDLVNVISEEVASFNTVKSYSHVNIHWNKFTSTCNSLESYHAENYLKLIDKLLAQNRRAMAGDICSKDYDTLLQTTLGDTVLELIGFKYRVASVSKNPKILKVSIVKANGDEIVITPDRYIESSTGDDYFIEFQIDLKEILKSAKKLRVIIEEQI